MKTWLDLLQYIAVVILCITLAVWSYWKDKPEQSMLWWMMLILWHLWAKLDVLQGRIEELTQRKP